jgi:hypothetical protein
MPISTKPASELTPLTPPEGEEHHTVDVEEHNQNDAETDIAAATQEK